MKNWVTYLILVLVLTGITAFWVSQAKMPNDDNDAILNKVDSLQTILATEQHKRDTLREVIDSSKTTTRIIEKWYEKETRVIATQCTDSDIVYFTKYLSSEAQ